MMFARTLDSRRNYKTYNPNLPNSLDFLRKRSQSQFRSESSLNVVSPLCLTATHKDNDHRKCSKIMKFASYCKGIAVSVVTDGTCLW